VGPCEKGSFAGTVGRFRLFPMVEIPREWLVWEGRPPSGPATPFQGVDHPMSMHETRSFPTAPRSASKGFGNWLKTGVLLAAMTALILGIGYWLGGSRGLQIALIFAIISNFGAFWFSDQLAL